jgi:hypothetical protein
MKYIYLSIIASSFVVVGYFPEIYLTILQKNPSGYSFGIWLIAGFFSILYNVLNDEYFGAVNYSINTFLTVIVLLVKIHCKKNEIDRGYSDSQTGREICDIVHTTDDASDKV